MELMNDLNLKDLRHRSNKNAVLACINKTFNCKRRRIVTSYLVEYYHDMYAKMLKLYQLPEEEQKIKSFYIKQYIKKIIESKNNGTVSSVEPHFNKYFKKTMNNRNYHDDKQLPLKADNEYIMYDENLEKVLSKISMKEESKLLYLLVEVYNVAICDLAELVGMYETEISLEYLKMKKEVLEAIDDHCSTKEEYIAKYPYVFEEKQIFNPDSYIEYQKRIEMTRQKVVNDN